MKKHEKPGMNVRKINLQSQVKRVCLLNYIYKMYFTRRIFQWAVSYFGLECRVKVSEEGVLPGESQDSLFHHGTLHIIIHENDVLLQNLHGKELTLSPQLR